jgi:hypothetical protein
MGSLLKLKTDLKSIKYGHDRADGGSSGQPYIKTDINTVDRGINRLRFGNFDEGLVRGGVIGMLNSSITDTLRIGKFLTDTPKGPLFIVKQVGLQLSNPRLESKEVKTNRSTTGGGFITNAINFVANVAGKIENAVGPTRIYNLGINTLAQVPLNGIGGHIVRHGFLPTSDPNKYYSAVVTHNNENGTNRLELLATKFQLGDKKTNLTISKNKIKLLNTITDIIGKFTGITIPALKPTQLTISNYIGGPGSVYGIGNTLISRTTFTEDKFKVDLALKQSKAFSGKTRDNKGDPQEIKQIDRFFGVSNIVSSSLSTYSFDPSTKKGPISNNDNNIPTTLNDNLAKEKDKFIFHQRPADLPTVSNVRDISLNGPSTFPGAYTREGDKTSNVQVSSPTLVYGRDYNNINTKVENLSSSSPNLGIYTKIIHKTEDNIGNQLLYPTSLKSPKYKNSYGQTITLKGKWTTLTRETRVGAGRKDEATLTPIFEDEMGSLEDDTPILVTDSSYPYQKKLATIRDLVKFRIQAIDTHNPMGKAMWMIFRAYLTAFSDGVDATWSPIKYAGRGDQFYIYDGFTRKMSVSFKVAALSAEEMEPMYQKLNYLMSNLMPDYSDQGGTLGVLMKGPLVRMTIGNYIDGQLCKLDSVSYTIPQDSPWEISLASQDGKPLELNLPHIIEVQLSFTPIGSQTRDKNRLSRKTDGTSHIAQNWNSTGPNKNIGGAEREYIYKEEIPSPVPPSPVPPTPEPAPDPDPVIVPPPLPIVTSDFTGRGATFERSQNKESRLKSADDISLELQNRYK